MNFTGLKSGLSYAGSEIPAFKSEKKSTKYLYLIGGVHGDEVEGVYVLEKFFEWLKAQDDIDIPTVVIPILNVDGYQLGTRVNSRGVDLNRNFPTTDWSAEFSEDKYNPGSEPLSESENVYLTKLMKKFPPGLIISFHSWKPILNFNGDCENVAQFMSDFNHYPVQGDIGYPTPGSFGTYAPAEFEAPVITFEFPKLDNDKLLKDIWEENQRALKTLAKSDLLQSFLAKKKSKEPTEN